MSKSGSTLQFISIYKDQAVNAGLCELDYFCIKAHLHRKGLILCQMYVYYLISICADSKGALRHYLHGSLAQSAFGCFVNNFSFCLICVGLAVCKSDTVFFLNSPLRLIKGTGCFQCTLTHRYVLRRGID